LAMIQPSYCMIYDCETPEQKQISDGTESIIIGANAGLAVVNGYLGFKKSASVIPASAGGAEGSSAADAVEPDTSEWACEACPFVYGAQGSILIGAGWVSDDLFEFGTYRGLEESGIYPAVGVDLRYRSEDARYLLVRGDRLGIDSRYLAVDAGRQGAYGLEFSYNEIPYYRADDTRSIFVGAGTSNQTLPPGWVRAGTTDGMTSLGESLRGIEIGHERKTLGLALKVERESPWQYRVGVERTRKQGNLIRGASFIFRAAELAYPIDYETTQVDASVGYVRDRWQLKASYHLSDFDNGNRSVTWENPFLGINGADRGRLAQAPENHFHQFMVSGSWFLSRRLRLAGNLAFGRGEQDEPFLDATVNPLIANPVLPRSDLDGRIDTRILNLRATSDLTSRLRTKLQFSYDERDNKTPAAEFVQVVADTFLTDERSYEPFSYERTRVEGAVDYRFASFLKVTASAWHKGMKRSLQEVEDTDTRHVSLQVRATPISRLNLDVEVSREERRNDLDPALLGPQVNPSLRRFHFSEKDRDAVRAVADFAISDKVSTSLYAEYSDEEYADTEIGLSDGRAESYGLDVSASLSRHLSGHAFVALESLRADILGADNIDGAEWSARQKDEFRTAGLGLTFDNPDGRWVEAGLNLVYASADGDIRVEKRNADPAFPELETRRVTLEATAERVINDRLNLRLAYLMGKLTEDDFFRDDIAPDTVPTLLRLGEQTPDGTVHVVSVQLRYRFD
ncbi:MAG: MtrB/PioB family decaheme-associated outer membrane protein, partial [Wenzhouxiangellaceae bacterium]|nr:MtrB/PioB family decaheme-associated outer membrane protein [Wenzhouxiangellaceae bacterium]